MSSSDPPPATRLFRELRRLAASLTAAELLSAIVGLGLVLRYLWLVDDSFIYFRYVDNLVFLGRGLVFNAGEYVEGFTSPAFALLLAALRLTRLDFFSLIGGIAVLSFLGTFALWLRVDRALAGPIRLSLPALLLAPCYGVTQYFSSGLETPLVLLSASVTAVFILERRNRLWGILFGLVPIVRHELAVPFVLVLLWFSVRERRVPWWPLGSAALSVGGWLCFRVYYYAELLPNTFYLKDESSPEQGLLYLQNSFGPYPLVYVAVGALALLGYLAVRRRAPLRSEARMVMLVAALASLGYVVRVGGDMLHFRFVLFPAVLLALSSSGSLEAVLARAGVVPGSVPRALLAVALLAAGAACYPAQLQSHPLSLHEKMQKVNGISESSWHRQQADLAFRAGRPAEDRAQRAAYAQYLTSGARSQGLVLHGWCAKLYKDFPSYALHDWGLTDPWLARLNVPADRPGHKGALNRVFGPQLFRMRQRVAPGPGSVRAAVEGGHAPPFIQKNQKAAEVVEAKAYNRHDFFDNLRLALTRVPKLEP